MLGEERTTGSWDYRTLPNKTLELVKNTGYDEYSLLSLSSNDYSNIKEVIKEN